MSYVGSEDIVIVAALFGLVLSRWLRPPVLKATGNVLFEIGAVVFTIAALDELSGGAAARLPQSGDALRRRLSALEQINCELITCLRSSSIADAVAQQMLARLHDRISSLDDE